MPAATPFFVLFFGRSGSSYLQKLLDDHPDVFCTGEIFNPRSRTRKFAEAGASEKKLAGLYGRDVRAAGFEYKYPKQPEHFPEVNDWLLARSSEIRVIHLYRRNRLKGAVSIQNLRKIKQATQRANLGTDTPYHVPPLHLDVEAARKRIDLHERADEEYTRFRERFRNVHELTYEDLCRDPGSATNAVLAFLGVPPRPLSADLRKATSDDLRSALDNYDEVASALAGTRYEKYLHMP